FTLVRTLPPSTLFPYTTLFRSRRRWIAMAQSAAPCRSTRRCRSNRSCYFLAPFGYIVGWTARNGPARHFGLDLCATDRSRRHLIDRKSTRLNSSHVAISYAVFC